MELLLFGLHCGQDDAQPEGKSPALLVEEKGLLFNRSVGRFLRFCEVAGLMVGLDAA